MTTSRVAFVRKEAARGYRSLQYRPRGRAGRTVLDDAERAVAQAVVVVARQDVVRQAHYEAATHSPRLALHRCHERSRHPATPE